MNETKIANCPGCGGEPPYIYAVKEKQFNTRDDRWSVECGHIECFYRSPRRPTKAAAIVAHNALCADIEKGRLWDEANVTWVAMLKRNQDHLDTAVGLLRAMVHSPPRNQGHPQTERAVMNKQHKAEHIFWYVANKYLLAMALPPSEMEAKISDCIDWIAAQIAADAAALTEDKE